MRVFLDASVFLWAAERPESNSAKIVSLALAGAFTPIVDEIVLAEVGRYLRPRRGRSSAWLFSQRVRRHSVIVPRSECEKEVARSPDTLKPADRLHVAACRVARCELLVAFDRDFTGIPEYRTPREAARHLGLPLSDSLW